MSCVKHAHECDTSKVAQLMETIRSEHPEHWPYGLSQDMFEPGDLYLIAKSASEDPVGFVGWQERELGGQRVGLYSIGVLPQHRHQGIAKEAVHQLLKQKAAHVDRVAAMVVAGNTPSEKLAESLGVPLLRKSAGLGDIVKFLGSKKFLVPAGALGNATTFDYMAPGRREGVLPFTGEWGSKRVINTLLNAAVGAGAAAGAHSGMKIFRDPALMSNAAEAAKAKFLLGSAGASIMATPMKDIQVYTPEALKGMSDLPKAILESARIQAGAKGEGGKPAEPTSVWPWLAGAGLLTAGLGAGAYALQKAIRDKAEAPVNITTNQGGRLKVTLPTRNKGDAETVLDLPFNQQRALTNALQRQLELGARRRLYEEVKERVRRRKDHAAMRELHPQMAFLPQHKSLPQPQ